MANSVLFARAKIDNAFPGLFQIRGLNILSDTPSGSELVIRQKSVRTHDPRIELYRFGFKTTRKTFLPETRSNDMQRRCRRQSSRWPEAFFLLLVIQIRVISPQAPSTHSSDSPYLQVVMLNSDAIGICRKQIKLEQFT